MVSELVEPGSLTARITPGVALPVAAPVIPEILIGPGVLELQPGPAEVDLAEDTRPVPAEEARRAAVGDIGRQGRSLDRGGNGHHDHAVVMTPLHLVRTDARPSGGTVQRRGYRRVLVGRRLPGEAGMRGPGGGGS